MTGYRMKGLIAAAAAVFAGGAQAADVVISQFRVDGPSGGNDEFIELLNTTAGPVAIGGWQVQGCAAGSGAASTRATIPAGTMLASGQYYLLTNSGSNGYSGPVPGDQTYATGIANNGNSGIRLVNGSTPVDGVGIGTGVCVEGTPISSFATTEPNRAFMRLDSGTRDTNNNAADFAAPGASNPHNRLSPPLMIGGGNEPSVSISASSATFGENGGTTTITATLSEAVLVPVTIDLAFAGTALRDVDYTAGSATLTIPAGELTASTVLTGIDDLLIEGDETAIVSLATVMGAAIGAPAMVTTTVLDDDMAPPMVGTRIWQIQGAAHVSPMSGMTVTNVPGVVTARASNGFYLQDPEGDGNPDTSDAIFVFTSSAPPAAAQVGAEVLVSGRVSEFTPGGVATGNLSITQLGNPGLSVTAVPGLFSNPMITPVVLGIGGRVPPNFIIDNDTVGSVNIPAQTTYDPAEDGIDFYESVEGMLVQVNNGRVVGARNQFNEVFLVSDLGANATSLNPRGGITLVQRPEGVDFNPERIQIQGGLNGITMPALDVADVVPRAVGVVSYAFGNTEVLLTEPLTDIVDGGLQPAMRTIDAGGERVTVASYNVLNLDPGDNTFAAFASQIVNNLGSPDIVALAEVQDDTGPTNNGVVVATQTLTMLVDAIRAAGGPDYAFVEIAPQNNQDGGEPGGNIRVAQLYNPARVEFVPGTMGSGDAISATNPVKVGDDLRLTLSPGRIEPLSSAWNASRKPLAVNYRFNGESLIVVNNHFNSKGGDQPLFGANQPPMLTTEAQRRLQAELVHNFVASALALDADAKIVVTGDLNDFGFSRPLAILQNGVNGDSPALVNLGEVLVPNPTERYSFVFQGNSQELDHTLATPALFAAGAQFESLHVNVEFADFISDHDPQIASFRVIAPDASPDAFAFAPVVDAPANQFVESEAITVSGINVAVPVTVSGGEVSINGAPYVSMLGLMAQNGDLVRVRVRTANAFAATTEAVLTIGDQSATFRVTTAAADTAPDAFAFAPATAQRLRTEVISQPAALLGFNAPTPIAVAEGEYSLNGGAFTTAAGTARPGDVVRLRGLSANRLNTTTSVTVTVGGVSSRFDITTRRLLERAAP